MRNFTQSGFRIQILIPLAECLFGHNLRHAVNIHVMVVKFAFRLQTVMLCVCSEVKQLIVTRNGHLKCLMKDCANQQSQAHVLY